MAHRRAGRGRQRGRAAAPDAVVRDRVEQYETAVGESSNDVN